MSSNDSKQNRKSKSKQNLEENLNKLTKDEEKIAKYLRFNVQTKKANLHGMKVEYFLGSKAVDFLFESKWGAGCSTATTSPTFPSRQSCCAFMKKLLLNEYFHRAAKVYKEEKQPLSSGGSGQVTSNDQSEGEQTPKVRKRKQNQVVEQDGGDKASKKKFKLEMHDEQKFIDGMEPFVWIYDPTTPKTMFIGSLLVIGAIGICMFPLWPPMVRDGVYYVSVSGACFLGVLLGLAVFKYVLFTFLWLVTLGKIHFWLLPNLTEDCGFLESFQPFYKCNCEAKKDEKSEKEVDNVKSSDEFNKLPIEEQLMSKFDENIDEEGEIKDKNGDNEEADDDGYEIVDNVESAK